MSQPPERDLRNIWLSQETEKTTMSVEEVRIKAQRFLNRTKRDIFVRSAFAVAAGIFCGFVFMTARLTEARVIAGVVTAMLLAGTVRNLYVWYSRSPGPSAGLTSCLQFYRDLLERQRELARIPAWQLATALLIIAWLARNKLGSFNRTVMGYNRDPMSLLLLLVLIAAAGLIVLLAVRKFEARKVQAEIDALDRFEEETH